MGFLSKKHDITLGQVQSVLALKSWWASVAILPLANRLVVWVCNYTELRPNHITAISALMKLLAAVLFLQGSPLCLVGGAFAYQFSYIVDCVDGPVARLKGFTSEFGRYFDHLTDLVGGLLCLAALAAGLGMLDSPLVHALLFIHMAEFYISYLANAAFSQSTGGQSAFSQKPLVRLFWRYRQFFFSRHFKSFFSFPDYEAVIFFVFPLMGQAAMGIEVGFYMAMATTLYTVLSTFVSLHGGERRFP